MAVRLQQASTRHPVGFARADLFGYNDSTISLATFMTVYGDAFGDWAEIVSATPRPVRAVTPIFQMNSTGGVPQYYPLTHEVAIGSSGAELSVYAKRLSSIYDDWPAPLYSPALPVSWPAGTRIAARSRSILWTANNGVAFLLFS